MPLTVKGGKVFGPQPPGRTGRMARTQLDPAAGVHPHHQISQDRLELVVAEPEPADDALQR